MKIAKRDLKLLLILAGLLVFLMLYMLVFNPLQTRITETKAQNAQLSEQVQDLEAKYLRMSEYQEGIKAGRENVEKQLKSLPGNVKEEDILSYLLTMEASEEIYMESVTFNTPELVQQFDMMTVKDGQDVAVPAGAYRVSTVMTGTMNYPQAKNVINYLYASPKQTNLESVTLTYSAESGELSTTFQLGKYFVNWDGAEYVPERVPTVPMGLPDLFGTTGYSAAPAATPEVTEGT